MLDLLADQWLGGPWLVASADRSVYNYCISCQ